MAQSALGNGVLHDVVLRNGMEGQFGVVEVDLKDAPVAHDPGAAASGPAGSDEVLGVDELNAVFKFGNTGSHIFNGNVFGIRTEDQQVSLIAYSKF